MSVYSEVAALFHPLYLMCLLVFHHRYTYKAQHPFTCVPKRIPETTGIALWRQDCVVLIYSVTEQGRV